MAKRAPRKIKIRSSWYDSPDTDPFVQLPLVA